MWNKAAAIAARQHGVVHRRQLIGLGMTVDAINGLVRRGRLVRVATAVYAVAGAPETALREPMVAVLRCGPGTKAVGPRMLHAQGVHHLDAFGPFEVLTVPGRRYGPLPWSMRPDRHPDLGPRTQVVEVASVCRPRNVLESAAGPATDGELRDVVDAYKWVTGSLRDVRAMALTVMSHVGAQRLAGLGLLVPNAPESNPERDLELIVSAYGAERQVDVAPGIRVDFLIRSAALVIEYDGAGHDPVKDRARDARLRRLGYQVLHVRKEHLRNPAALRQRIERHLAAAGV